MTIASQGGDERLCPPMPKRSASFEALSSPRAPAKAGHLGRCTSLIQEDQAVRTFAHPGLTALPPDLAFIRHFGASGFGGLQRFF
ncbi:MAG: hypothetical protein ACM31D_07955 [Bacteroidota bacterium]